MPTRVLVTGGAGYIGSFCTRALLAAGHEVVVVDDLSSGHREAVDCRLVELDLRDRPGLGRLLGEGFDSVVHLAGVIAVGESIREPSRYLDINVRGSLSLLDAMRERGVAELVFSSTCALYEPSASALDEDAPLGPISPYARTKAMVEQALVLARGDGLRSFCLRYFNAAGAAEDGSLGEAHEPETHLIPLAIDAALGGRALTIFGDDYPTRDGTCVRDYVHVLDLADAHCRAVAALRDGHPGAVLNLGTGTGVSVREVATTVADELGCELQLIVGARRPGDQPTLVARGARAATVLGWSSQHDIAAIVASACRWHRNPRFGPGARAL